MFSFELSRPSLPIHALFNTSSNVWPLAVRYSPSATWSTTPTQYALDVMLPGVSIANIDVHIQDRVLTVSSVQSSDQRAHNWRKSWHLPEDVSTDGVQAHLHLGVLHIFIPRQTARPLQKIVVQEGAREQCATDVEFPDTENKSV